MSFRALPPGAGVERFDFDTVNNHNYTYPSHPEYYSTHWLTSRNSRIFKKMMESFREEEEEEKDNVKD